MSYVKKVAHGAIAYSITEHMGPGADPGSWHKPDGRLPLLFARPAVTLATLKRAAIPVSLLGEQRHDGCEQFA